MKTPNFIFQTDFSSFTSEVLKRRFKLVEGDRIQMVIWMGHIHNLSVRDRYFVFTKQGIFWNFPAIVQSGEEGKTAERIISDSDFFQKEGSSFSLVFTKCDGDLNELHIKMGERTFVFQFTKNFPKERLEDLEKIIRDYFTGYFDAVNYNVRAKKDKFKTSLFNVPDFFRQTGFVISNGYITFLNCIENFFENLSEKKNKQEKEKVSDSEKENVSSENIQAKSTQKSSIPQQYENRFVRFIRHTFDLLADLFFVMAVIILVKENLVIFDFSGLSKIFSFSALVKAITINGTSLLSENFAGHLILFAILKLFVILSCKNIRRIVPFLLLIILCFSCILIKISFLIFLILSLLILLTLQFSMNFKLKTIKRKIKLFIVLTFALYVCLHLKLPVSDSIYSESSSKYIDLFLSFFKELTFPANWLLIGN